MTDFAIFLVATLLYLLGTAAWVQHIHTCFTEERWGFLVAGAICFPVAIVHGVGIWLGVW